MNRFILAENPMHPEHWTLSIHHLFTTNMAASDDDQASARASKLIDKAWHWYKNYLIWEDNNIDNNFNG